MPSWQAFIAMQKSIIFPPSFEPRRLGSGRYGWWNGYTIDCFNCFWDLFSRSSHNNFADLVCISCASHVHLMCISCASHVHLFNELPIIFSFFIDYTRLGAFSRMTSIGRTSSHSIFQSGHLVWIHVHLNWSSWRWPAWSICSYHVLFDNCLPVSSPELWWILICRCLFRVYLLRTFIAVLSYVQNHIGEPNNDDGKGMRNILVSLASRMQRVSIVEIIIIIDPV